PSLLRHGRRDRSQQLDPPRQLASRLARLGQKLQGLLSGFSRVTNGGEAAEGRPCRLLPFLERRTRETVVAFREQAEQQWMARKLGLNQHLARSCAPSRPSR